MQDKKVISYGLKEATSQHTELNKSSIFEITVPYEFALGMNEVKLNLTSRYLRQGTDILIDVNDPSGNPLYYEISPIANSDNSRSIVVHISDTALPGKAQMILYCVLINGETYKCIIERNILVKETSTSDVKFSESPKVIYSEKLLPVQLMTSTSRLVNKTFSDASVSTIGGIVPKQLVSDALTVEVRELTKAEPANTVTNGIGTSSIQEVPNKINYSILTGKGFAFSSSMVGGTIIVDNIALEAPKDAINTSLFQNQKYSASILNVINTSSIEIFPPFFKKIDYANSAGEQKVQSFDRFFNHGNFTASYYEAITLAEASVTQSYAVLDILNLNNTSGKIAGIDVSYKPIGNLGSNFKSLGVFDIQANNLLVDKTNVYFDPKLGIIERPIGLFKNGISDFYTYWTATGNQPATLSASTRVSDGVLLTFPPAYTGSSDNVIIKPKDTYLFLAGKNSDFQFDIQVFSEQVFQKSPQIDVYISGSDVVGTSIIDDVEYEPIFSSSFGKYIGSFGPKVRSGQLTFTNKKEGYILPVFILRYANWHIGDIEIKPLTKEGFNPSQTKIIASTELITGSELTIQLDYLDAKGKKSKFSTIIDKVYFKGSTVPVSVSGSGGGGPTPVLPSGLISGSDQLTSSYDARYERTGRGIISSSNQVKALLPADLISSSEQVAYNKITGVPANIISSSLQFASVLSPFTGSFTGSFKGDGSGLYNLPISSSSIPLGTVSGSNQLTSSYDVRYELRGNNIVSSSAQVKAFLPIGSVSGSDQATSSYDTRYERKGTNIFSSSAQVIYSSVTGIPTGLITGSNQLTSSYDTRYERKGTNIFSSSVQVIYSSVTGIPTGLVSGSNQLTSSYDTRYERRGNNIVSSSVQVKAFLPLGSVSGSNQLTSSYDSRYERKGTNILSSSQQIASDISGSSNSLSSSFQIRVGNLERGSGSFATTGSNTFVGNQTITGSVIVSGSGSEIYNATVYNPILSGSEVVVKLLNTQVSSFVISSSLASTYRLRFASAAPNQYEWNTNASWNGSVWTKDDSTRTAWRIVQNPTLFDSTSKVFFEVLRSGSLTPSRVFEIGPFGAIFSVPVTASFLFSSSQQVIESLPLGTVSGSNQLTSSYDTRYELRGSNILSSSNQFTSFSSPFTGSFTGSFNGLFTGDGSGLYNIPLVSGSVPMGTVTGSDQLTSSYDTRYERKGTNIFSSSAQVTFSGITGIPSTLVSGSNQLTSSYDTRYEVRGNNIVSSSAQIKAFLPSNSVSGSEQLTSSYDVRYERKGTNIFSSSAQVTYNSVTGIPTGLITGSNQLTSSYDTRYELRGNNIVSSSVQVKAFLPVGSVSGSDQATSSYDSRYERRGNNIISSSLQFASVLSPFTGSFTGSFKGDGSGLYNLPISSSSIPAGTVSGSDQLTSSLDIRYEKRGTGIFSSSAQIVSAFPNGIVSGSTQLTSSYDTRYELRGSNIVSSSNQFTSFSSPFTGSFTGSFKGSFTGDGSGLYNIPLVSGSVPMGTVTGSDQLTSSYDTRYERKGTNIFSSSVQVVYGSITGIPTTLISGSNQLTSSYDVRYEVRGNNIVSSSVQVKAFLPANTISGSDQATSSYDTRYERKGTNIFSSSVQVVYGSITGIPTNLVSGSNQLTSSYDARYEIRGNNIISSSVQVKAFLPSGTVSGSDQSTSSFDTRYENRGNNIVSSSVQVKAFLPNGTVSGSDQSTSSYDTRYERKGTGILSSSQQISSDISGSFTNASSSFQIRVSNLESKSGSFATTGSNTFVGNQTITGSVVISGSKSEIYDAVVHNPILSGSEVVVRLLNNAANALVLSSSLATAFRTRLAFSTVQQSDWNSNIYYNGSVWNKDDLTRIGWRMTQVPTTLDSTSRLSVEVFKSGSVAATRLLDIKPSEVVFNVPITASGMISASGQINYNELLNKPVITLPQSDRLLSSDGTVSGSRANDGLQYVSSSKWTKLLLRTNVIQEQTYSSSFWSSQWTFVSQSTFVASPANRNFSVYVPAGFNNDTNTPITSSTFHSSYAIEVENHIYGVTGSMSSPLNAYNWNSTTQFRAYYNPANLTLNPLISGYSAQSSSVYNGMGGYGGAYTGRPDLNAWYSVTGVSYAGDGLFKVDLTLGPSSSFGWTLYIATTAKVIKHEIRV